MKIQLGKIQNDIFEKEPYFSSFTTLFFARHLSQAQYQSILKVMSLSDLIQHGTIFNDLTQIAQLHSSSQQLPFPQQTSCYYGTCPLLLRFLVTHAHLSPQLFTHELALNSCPALLFQFCCNSKIPKTIAKKSSLLNSLF